MMLTTIEPENFRAFDAIGNSVFVIQRDKLGEFHLIHLNTAYRTRVGDLADSMIGPVATVFPARIAETLAQNYRDVLSASGPVVLDELLAIAGIESWWRTTLTPDPDVPGRLIGSAVEITELEGRAQSLTRALAETHERLAELRTIAALTAHDTRAPLANVVSLVELIVDGFEDKGNGKVDMLNACSEVASGALDAIESLMSRVGDSAPRTKGRDRINLGQTCREIASIVDPTGRLAIDLAEATIVSDFVILQATLRNLLDNAARYARSRIEVSIRQGTGDQLELVVADDGAGIPDGADPLRIDQGGKQIDGKRGYGMAAVAQLLRSCGGSLGYAPSRFGSGAALRIRIPGVIVTEPALRQSA